MNNPLIDDLVADLKPVKALKTANLMALAFAAFAAILIFVILTLGFRADLRETFNNGVIFWKNGGLLLGAISAGALVTTISKPQNREIKWAIIPIFAIAGLILAQFMPLIANQSLIYEATHINFGGWQTCVTIITLGGAMNFALLWFFWLKKTASSAPRILGIAAGALSALLAAFAYSFHCNMDAPFYFLICYWLPIAFFAAIGAALSKKLEW